MITPTSFNQHAGLGAHPSNYKDLPFGFEWGPWGVVLQTAVSSSPISSSRVERRKCNIKKKYTVIRLPDFAFKRHQLPRVASSDSTLPGLAMLGNVESGNESYTGEGAT